MEKYGNITFYCFNRKCSISVYQHRSALMIYPLNLDTLSHDPKCSRCKAKLISLIDLEIKEALTPAYA